MSGLLISACSQADTDHDSVKHHEHHEHHEHHVSETSKPSTQTPHSQAKPVEVQSSTNDVRSADSHIHGGAVLSIVSEKNMIFVELETPLYNLLGFEYAPRTPEEKTTVEEVEARIAQPQSLISFNDEANCKFNDLGSPAALFETHIAKDEDEDEHGHDEDHGDEHDDDGHGHDDHADHEEVATHDDHDHDDNDNEHHDEDDHVSDHKDIILKYSLNCANIEKLKSVEVDVFAYFPNFSELDLVYLGPSQQMSAELSASKPKADLSQ